MDYSRFLSPKTILLNLDVSDRKELVDKMVDALANAPVVHGQSKIEPSRVIGALDSRELRHGAFGNGFVCPHVRLSNFHGLALSIAALKHPISWTADQPPINLAALLVIPAESPTLALRLLAQLARLALDKDARAKITSANSADDIFGWIRERLFDLDIPLTAADVMRPLLDHIGPETPLRVVTHRMVALNLDAVGIVGEGDRLLGEITADRLFAIGMPDFFAQLKSVSFIAEFDPFEKFFEDEGQRVAKDVMSDNYGWAPPTATILEVVFLLVVKRFAKVYVLDSDRRVLGIIDRIRVIDRILNV